VVLPKIIPLSSLHLPNEGRPIPQPPQHAFADDASVLEYI
jgi:hypothetical protein